MRCLIVSSSLVVPLVLHGCGGGGDAPTKAPPAPTAEPTKKHITTEAPDVTSTVSVTTTAVTTTTGECDSVPTVPPGDDTPEGQLVDQLNSKYRGFDESDEDSPAGVTIRMLGKIEDEELFCGTDCYEGWADCRVSAALYNHKVMINHSTFQMIPMAGRNFGILYNQDAVEVNIGKCFYPYDGTTFHRVNHGCGCSATNNTCGNPVSAYNNQDCQFSDPTTRQVPILETCKDNNISSPDVDQCWCKSSNFRGGYGNIVADKENYLTTSAQCYFRGPDIDSAQLVTNEFWEGMKARVEHNKVHPTEVVSSNDTRYTIEYWNEVVIDANPLQTMLSSDPTTAYAAIIYTDRSGHEEAQKLQDSLKSRYPAATIPIIRMNLEIDSRCSGPFMKAEELPPNGLTV